MASFIKTLTDIGLSVELDEKLTGVVRAAEMTGKVGSITVQLKIKTKGNSGQVELTPVVKAAVPEHERGSAILFATPEGNLQLNDPRQPDLPLKQVEKQAEAKLKIVGAN